MMFDSIIIIEKLYGNERENNERVHDNTKFSYYVSLSVSSSVSSSILDKLA